jgi:hypothetical protein
MVVDTLRLGIRRFTWRFLSPETRRLVKSGCAKLVGRITRQRPHVEVFGASSAGEIQNQIRAQLEQIDLNAPTELCQIMTSFGSDKGSGRHNYTTVYHHLFADLRHEKVSLFELGIGTNNPELVSSMGVTGKPGASLRGWEMYFRFGGIFGADIDRDILFHEGRIQTFYCDQLSKKAIDEMWAEPPLTKEFDIVIEDGLHTFEANVSFLENSLQKVRRGGYYIVEDLRKDDLPKWRKLLQSRYSVTHAEFSFSIVILPWLFNKSDNVLLVARRH